ncbi:hypothetical protein J437_LFUL013110 [Ladona fulva]|uniref:Uncharacterized protein n=1 Tax=Ladona fulva TaxID=123851 RepID=A0A8K0KL08_LADFU|nr:hypothetical protein J437_LFUL013110 [Ladona fulva]
MLTSNQTDEEVEAIYEGLEELMRGVKGEETAIASKDAGTAAVSKSLGCPDVLASPSNANLSSFMSLQTFTKKEYHFPLGQGWVLQFVRGKQRVGLGFFSLRAITFSYISGSLSSSAAARRWSRRVAKANITCVHKLAFTSSGLNWPAPGLLEDQLVMYNCNDYPGLMKGVYRNGL